MATTLSTTHCHNYCNKKPQVVDGLGAKATIKCSSLLGFCNFLSILDLFHYGNNWSLTKWRKSFTLSFNCKLLFETLHTFRIIWIFCHFGTKSIQFLQFFWQFKKCAEDDSLFTSPVVNNITVIAGVSSF